MTKIKTPTDLRPNRIKPVSNFCVDVLCNTIKKSNLMPFIKYELIAIISHYGELTKETKNET